MDSLDSHLSLYWADIFEVCVTSEYYAIQNLLKKNPKPTKPRKINKPQNQNQQTINKPQNQQKMKPTAKTWIIVNNIRENCTA